MLEEKESQQTNIIGQFIDETLLKICFLLSYREIRVAVHFRENAQIEIRRKDEMEENQLGKNCC